MTALNFPASPSVGQTYTFNNRTWSWDGTTWQQSVGTAASGMMKIGQVVCVGGETTITFANIPQNFSDLEIIFSGRDTNTGTTENTTWLQFNGDATAGNYSASQYHQGIGSSTAAASIAATSTGGVFAGIPGTSGNANAFGSAAIVVPAYTGTSFYKSVRSSYIDYYGSGPSLDTADIGFVWKSTAAVTKLVLTAGGTAFAAGTTATLYGLGGTSYAASVSADPGVCQGRLTLTTLTPVTTADVTGATTIYFTPYKGSRISLYDGVATWNMFSFSELSVALGTLVSATNYDVFAYNNSGTLGLEFSAAWASNTARTDAISLQDGVYVKTGNKTRRYLGTFRTTSTTTTEDSGGGVTTQVGGKRFLWNLYNRVRRQFAVFDSTAEYSYNTATWRQQNAAAGNKVEYVCGLLEDPVDFIVADLVSENGASKTAKIAVGVDSTTTTSGSIGANFGASGTSVPTLIARYEGFPGLGYHALNCLQNGGGAVSYFGLIQSDQPVSQGGILA